MKTIHHLKIANNILISEVDSRFLGAWLLIFKMTETAAHIHERLFSGDLYEDKSIHDVFLQTNLYPAFHFT